MKKIEFYERVKIDGEETVQKRDVKKLKCELNDVVYYRCSNSYGAYDLNSGLVIEVNVKKLVDLIEKVNALKDRIEEIRNSESYMKNVERHNEYIKQCEVSNE